MRIATFDEIVERLTAMTPELAESELRLPSPAVIPPPSDPDAAHAAAIMGAPRAAYATPDRLGYLSSGAIRIDDGPISGGLRSGSPGVFSATPPYPAPAPKGWPLILGAGGAMAIVVMLMFVIVAITRSGPSTVQSASSAAVSATVAVTTSTAEPSASASTSNEVPVVSVDSLPVATGRSRGRLTITASPGHCNVRIDGLAQGITPISNLELNPGAHRIECAPPRGKTRTGIVIISEGSVQRYRFQLDD
jgi:hypothetical protein